MTLRKGNLEDVFLELTDNLPADSDLELDFDDEEDEA